MNKFNFSIIFFVTLFLLAGCQTVKKKTDAVIEKENKMLSKYIGQSATKLQMDLGKPDEDFENEKGNFVMIYNTKKYGFPCERRFEINPEKIVVGFASNGCF